MKTFRQGIAAALTLALAALAETRPRLPSNLGRAYRGRRHGRAESASARSSVCLITAIP